MIKYSNEYEKKVFPCGEIHLSEVHVDLYGAGLVTMEYETSEDLVELAILKHTLDQNNYYNRKICLNMPYIPFSRQDRVNTSGECFSLKWFCEFINRMNFAEVFVCDPHSDVSTALLNNVSVTTQEQVFSMHFERKKDFYLVAPDGGSLKKIYDLAEDVDCKGVIMASKNRNTDTGEITGTEVHFNNDLGGRDCYIVDDICDGGRTFIEIAKILKKKNCGKIVLMVTHGFFTKGLDVFDGLIDEIYTRNGQVK